MQAESSAIRFALSLQRVLSFSSMKQELPTIPGPIGVFDSGYGGLTILSKIREALPQYDYIYLGMTMHVLPMAHDLSKLYMNSPYRQSLNCLKWDVILLSWLAIRHLPKHYAAYRSMIYPKWIRHAVYWVSSALPLNV